MQSDTVNLVLDLNVSQLTLDDIKQKLLEFVILEKRDFQPTIGLSVTGIVEPSSESRMKMLRVKVTVGHRSNFQDGALMAKRRTKFILKLRDTLVDMGVAALIL